MNLFSSGENNILLKPGFHRYDRYDLSKTCSAIAAITWKHYRGDRDRRDRKNSISAIVAIAAIKWKPLSSDRSDRMYPTIRCGQSIISQRTKLLHKIIVRSKLLSPLKDVSDPKPTSAPFPFCPLPSPSYECENEKITTFEHSQPIRPNSPFLDVAPKKRVI